MPEVVQHAQAIRRAHHRDQQGDRPLVERCITHLERRGLSDLGPYTLSFQRSALSAASGGLRMLAAEVQPGLAARLGRQPDDSSVDEAYALGLHASRDLLFVPGRNRVGVEI